MKTSTKHLLLLTVLVFTLSSVTVKRDYTSFAVNATYNLGLEYTEAPSDTVRGLTFQMFQKLTSSLDTLPNAMKRAWKLWKAEKWTQLETYFEKNNLNGEYPPADGFISVEMMTLVDDTWVDRYGSLWGTFVAPTGTPFGERSLPASSKSRTYYRFEVTKDIDSVLMGKAIPWFNEPGEGVQYMMPRSMKALVKGGYIVVLDSIVPKKLMDKYGD